MPTTAQAKKAWDHGRKSQNHYNALTPEQKSAFWQYGRDNGLVDRNNLDGYKANEFDTYVKTPFTRYEPTISKADMPEALKADKYANYQGPKVPLDKKYTSPKTPITPTQQISQQPMKPFPKVPQKGVTTETKPQTKTIPVGKAGIIKTQAPTVNKGVSALLQGAGTLGMETLNAVNSALQAPATIAVRGGEGSKDGLLGTIKGIGTGIKDVLTGQNTVSNTQFIEAVAPKTTAELKAKHPKAYDIASTVAELVGPDDLIGAGIVADLAKARNLNKVVNTTKDLTRISSANLPKTDINPQPIVNDALKANVDANKTTSKVYTDMQPPKSQIVSSSKKEKLGFWDSMNKFYTRVVDSSNPIKKVDADTYIKATNAKSTGGIVDHVLKNGLVDTKGTKIDKSLREVVEKIPKAKENEFWDYMLHRNNIDRAREGKAVYQDFTSEMSDTVAKRFETAHPEYKVIGDEIVNWLDKFTRTWGVDAGVVNKEMYEDLRKMYKSYVPTNREFSTLEDAIPQNVRSKFVDQRTPIKKATGSDRDIINPVENIMNLVNRTIRTAKYNEVGQTLLESVRKNPEKMKQFAEEIAVKDGMFANTDNIVTIMENGKPTYLKVNNLDLLTSLNAVPKQINNIKYISSAMNLYKGLITQKNPIFAIRNIFRDIPSAYVYGSEKNPIKFGIDLANAGKQAVTNGEMLQKYKSVGGGGANFFNAGNVTKSASELSKKPSLNPVKAIEKFNNLTETAPRLAEFTRVYEKTGDINKALYAANDVTVNFSRGGDITKSVDKVVPYLNAGVQGLDKFFREAKNNPLQVLTKAGISITAPTVGLYLVNKDNPNYQELDNRTKDTYFLIPNMSDKDENGNAKTFIKIPKSRELGVLFSALFERSARAFEGQDKAFKGFANTVATNFSPTNPIENNILSPLAYNIPTNKDFAGRSIVPLGMIMDNRSPYLQYDEKTSEIAKKIGELTKNVNGGLSPKQVDYIMKSYLGIIAQYGLPLNTKGNDPLKALTTQFKADPTYSNQTLTDFYDNLDKAKREAADTNIIGKIPSKLVTPKEKTRNILNKASLEISDINKEIRKLDQVTDKNKIEELRKKILNIANNANNVIK